MFRRYYPELCLLCPATCLTGRVRVEHVWIGCEYARAQLRVAVPDCAMESQHRVTLLITDQGSSRQQLRLPRSHLFDVMSSIFDGRGRQQDHY